MSSMIVAQFPRRVRAGTQLYNRVADVSLAKRRDTLIVNGRRLSTLTKEEQETKLSAALGSSSIPGGASGPASGPGGESKGWGSKGGWRGRKSQPPPSIAEKDSVFVTITEENMSTWQPAPENPTVAMNAVISSAAMPNDNGDREDVNTSTMAPSFGAVPDVESSSKGNDGDGLGDGAQQVFFDDAVVGGEGEGEARDDVVIDMDLLVHRTLKEMFEQGLLLGRHTISEVASHGYMTVMVTVSQELVHLVVLKLEQVGVGSEVGTLSIVPVSMVRASAAAAKAKDQVRFSRRLLTKLTDGAMLDAMSQIRIEKLQQDVRAGTTWSFDYACFLFCASMIAAMGLLSNSVVSIIAAMLVSPIMGPIVACTFGANTRDWSLMSTGLKMELVSLFGCILVGFFVQTIAMPFLGPNLDYPTSEMMGRTTFPNLAVGIFVALPSGAGVALSLMSDNMASLVGVAISASLLPPAVNCGMFFALATFGDELMRHHSFDSHELTRKGGISLLLTIENIVCVFLSAYFTFWIKQVTPIKRQQSLWREDLVRTRKLNAQRTKEDKAVRRNSTTEPNTPGRGLQSMGSERIWS